MQFWNPGLSIVLLGLAAVLPCQAEVHTFTNCTLPVNAGSLSETFDFVPNKGWTGTPLNAISGEPSVYLKVSISPTTDPDPS